MTTIAGGSPGHDVFRPVEFQVNVHNHVDGELRKSQDKDTRVSPGIFRGKITNSLRPRGRRVIPTYLLDIATRLKCLEVCLSLDRT